MAAPRHFLDLDEIDAGALRGILERSAEIKRRHKAGEMDKPLEGKVLAMIFEAPSTRTRVSFEVGMRQLGGQTVVVVGQERDKAEGETARHEGRTSPEGFRKAQRAFEFAAKFDLPLITLIDTPGPFLGVEAEERGLGRAIATTMAAMSQVEVPSLSVIIGEGGSEGAIALGVADRVLMMENAIYSTISPEGAAELIFQDEARADEVAESLKLPAQDCREYGIVDVIVPEPSGAAPMS